MDMTAFNFLCALQKLAANAFYHFIDHFIDRREIYTTAWSVRDNCFSDLNTK